MATYNTEQEILMAISDKVIFGVIEVEWNWFDERTVEQINDDYSNELVGEDFGYLLEDISYELVGCNNDTQTIFIRVSASAEMLLEDDGVNEKL